MILFIDTISPNSKLLLIKDKMIFSSKDIKIHGREYSDLLDIILGFLEENNIAPDKLDGLVAINGPGGFTGTRIVALIINTFQYIYRIPLATLDYFELLMGVGLGYPMLLKANRHEYLLKTDKDSNPQIISKDDISDGVYSGIGDSNDFENRDISIKCIEDYSPLVNRGDFILSLTRMEPYYIKKPNIT